MAPLGRCPDCGESVEVRIQPGRPGEIAPHGCPVRLCEYESCRRRGTADEMVLDGDSWHCPTHALVSLCRELVALYWLSRANRESGEARILELLGAQLPIVVEKFSEEEERAGCRKRRNEQSR